MHDSPAVARCLATAEALLSGDDASGQWAMPDSLPPSSIYQVRAPKGNVLAPEPRGELGVCVGLGRWALR